MDSYGVIELNNSLLSIPGAFLWVFFLFIFFGVADRAQTKTGSILAFLIMTGAFTAFLINMGWFFYVIN